ncbi:hypothetical protein F4780DRAFT_141474 [Xylariomycetidae sp. FL0641]|nr:hypothetical protein F4780DRAFT_141474 [Xylariomycetidae sp. FL0641]
MGGCMHCCFFTQDPWNRAVGILLAAAAAAGWLAGTAPRGNCAVPRSFPGCMRPLARSLARPSSCFEELRHGTVRCGMSKGTASSSHPLSASPHELRGLGSRTDGRCLGLVGVGAGAIAARTCYSKCVFDLHKYIQTGRWSVGQSVTCAWPRLVITVVPLQAQEPPLASPDNIVFRGAYSNRRPALRGREPACIPEAEARRESSGPFPRRLTPAEYRPGRLYLIPTTSVLARKRRRVPKVPT